MTSLQCYRKTFMVHQTFVRWALYILFKIVKSLIRHLDLAIGNVRHVRWFSWTLPCNAFLLCIIYYVFQREWELLTFLGCFIVLKNRKQGESMWSSLTQAVIYSLCSRGALGQVSYGVCSSRFRTLILFYGKPDSENIPCFREISKSWAPKVVQTQKTYPILGKIS